MSWTRVDTGSYLSQDIDGTAKQKPTLWLPKDRRLFIPENGQDHGRPIAVLRGDAPETTFVLSMYRDQIVGEFQGKRKVLVQL